MLNTLIMYLMVILVSLNFTYTISTFKNASQTENLDTFQKLLIFILVSLLILINGFNKKIRYELIISYSILLIITFFNSIFTPISIIDSITAFAGFVLGAIILHVEYKRFKIIPLFITLLPLFSILIKAFFSIFLGQQLFRLEFGSLRLQGLLSPAHLAFLCFNIIFFISVRYIISQKNHDLFILLINYTILILTKSRMGIFLASIIIFTLILLILRNKNIRSLFKYNLILSILIILPFFLFSTYSIFLSRFYSNNDSSIGINTSGRAEIWKLYLNKIDANHIFFGRGLGFTKSIETNTLAVSVTNSHNEYIRIFLENGYIGSTIFIYFLFLHFFRTRLLLKPCPEIKYLYTIFFITILIYSLSDNFFTTISSWFAYTLVISLVIKSVSEKNSFITKINTK